MRSTRHSWTLRSVGAILAISSFTISVRALQAQQITVDNSKMGVYRALAQVIHQSFEKGDFQTAAVLGRVLDKTWDRIEGMDERGFRKTNPQLFEEIDDAMDAFIMPVIHYDKKTPDASSVQAAYNAYLEKLKAAD